MNGKGYGIYCIRKDVADHYDCNILRSELIHVDELIPSYAEIKGISISHAKFIAYNNDITLLKKPCLGPNTKIILEFWKYYDTLNEEEKSRPNHISYSHIIATYWGNSDNKVYSQIERSLWREDRSNDSDFSLVMATAEILYNLNFKPYLKLFNFTF